ncbi:MAG TPA: hypothetical protein ACFYD3_07660 [Candidatus Hypogeohydataceae bacterium YC41]
MKITRRQSLKVIISSLGAPLLLRGEAVAQEPFQFSERMSGRIAEDTYNTNVYPPSRTRAIYDFERGEELGTSELSFSGFMVIDDLDKFEEDPRHVADYKGEVTYNGETVPISEGKVKLFSSEYPEYANQVRNLIYYIPFSTTTGEYVLSGYKKVKIFNLNSVDFVKDMTTLYTHLHQGPFVGPLDSPELGPMLGAGILRYDIRDIFGLIQSCQPISAAPRFFTIIAGEAMSAILPPIL